MNKPLRWMGYSLSKTLFHNANIATTLQQQCGFSRAIFPEKTFIEMKRPEHK